MAKWSRLVLVVLWSLLLAEALLLSPPARPDQSEWLLRIATGDWAAEEPLVVVLFNLMGVWPVAMGALLAPRLRRSPVPLWPFVVASMALGAFVLIPGLVLGGEPRDVRPWQRWLGSRWMAGLLLVPTVLLLAWGALAGSPAAFLQVWRTEQFVHIMALDFVTLWSVSILVAQQSGERWALALVPLVGPLLLRLERPATR